MQGVSTMGVEGALQLFVAKPSDLFQTNAWRDNLSMTCLSDNAGLAMRGVVCVRNIVAFCKVSAEAIVDR